MKKFVSLAAVAVALITTALASSASADFADLKVTFTYKGKAPAAKPVGAVADPFCSALKSNPIRW